MTASMQKLQEIGSHIEAPLKSVPYTGAHIDAPIQRLPYEGSHTKAPTKVCLQILSWLHFVLAIFVDGDDNELEPESCKMLLTDDADNDGDNYDDNHLCFIWF